MARNSGITRREVLTGAAGAAAAASLGGLAGCFPNTGGDWPDTAPPVCGCTPPDAGSPAEQNTSPVTGTSTVVAIKRDDAVDAKGKSLDQPQFDAVASMIDSVLSTLADGADNPWSAIIPGISKCTRIGLKVNCLNSTVATSAAVVRAIIKSLRTHHPDLCPGNIIVWDRRTDELVGAGKYTKDDLQGARLQGTINSMTDRTGPGYSTRHFGRFQGREPRISRIIVDQTDVTINLPVFKMHYQSGVTAAFKNIYGIIDIPGEYHSDEKNPDAGLQTALPALYAIPVIRNSIKLTIIDGLRAVIDGDTNKPCDATPCRIIGSMDPLALDYYAFDLLNQLRAAHRPALGPVDKKLTKWLGNAHAMGLGAQNYKLVTLGPDGEVTNDGSSPDAATG
jgi:uncharacterized protein (DUF362 family)